MLFQEGKVDAITGDDTVLAGLAAQDPYAEVVQAPAFTAEPYGLGVNQANVDFVRFVNGVLAQMRADGRWTKSYNTWLADALGKAPAPPAAGLRADAVIAAMASATAPAAPGRLGQPLVAQEALRYLEALGTWRDQRKAELDLLDEAALAGPGRSRPSPATCCSRWRCGRPSPTATTCSLATWDSGRVGPTELERLSTLVWGRLDATHDSRAAASAGARLPARRGAGEPSRSRCPRPAGSPTRSPPRCGPGWASTRRRPTSRHGCARCAPPWSASATSSTASRRRRTRRRSPMLDRLDARVADVLARAQRGADVGGLLGPLEHDAARAERDLIVGASNRRADAHDEARARALRAELEARGAALRDLAARCVAAGRPRPPPRGARRRRRSGPCPPTPPPWTPTWCGWTPSAGP